MSSTYEDLHKKFIAYKSAPADERPQLWESILEIARGGESGINVEDRSDYSFLCSLTESYEEELAVSFFKALTPENKKASIELENYVFDSKNLLMTACHRGYNKLVNEILEFGCDPNLSTPNGDRALLFAAMSNNAEAVVEALVKAGACPNLADELGRTPLMALCASGITGVDAINALLINGAHTHYEDDNNETALDIAYRLRYFEGVNAIESHHAKLTHQTLNEQTPEISRPSIRNRI